MSVLSIAILGRDNEPLYLKEFSTPSNQAEFHEEELFGLARMNTDQESLGNEPTCGLRQQFILHAAVDRFRQMAGPPPGYAWRTTGVSGTDGMFLGLLCPVEEMRVFGYWTSTKIKFIVVVEDDEGVPLWDDQAIDDRVKLIMVKVHRLYVEYVLNPFSSIDGPIQSVHFDKSIEALIGAMNASTAY